MTGTYRADRITLNGPQGPVTLMQADGPIWVNALGGLLFSDTAADTLYLHTPPDQVRVWKTPAGKPFGNTLNPDGLLIRAEQMGAVITQAPLDPAARVVNLCTHVFQIRDVVSLSNGRIFGTDYSDDCRVVQCAPMDNNKRYVQERMGRMHQPTGIALSPDERALYVTMFGTGLLSKYDITVNPTPGKAYDQWSRRQDIVNLRMVKDPTGAPLGIDNPAGLAVDDAGNLYVAGGQRVAILRPDGTATATIAVGEITTNLTFGDADRKTLYITGRTGLYKVRLPTPGLLQ